MDDPSFNINIPCSEQEAIDQVEQCLYCGTPTTSRCSGPCCQRYCSVSCGRASFRYGHASMCRMRSELVPGNLWTIEVTSKYEVNIKFYPYVEYRSHFLPKVDESMPAASHHVDPAKIELGRPRKWADGRETRRAACSRHGLGLVRRRVAIPPLSDALEPSGRFRARFPPRACARCARALGISSCGVLDVRAPTRSCSAWSLSGTVAAARGC